TVQGVLAARIDLLDPREKRTLQQASVVGRVFWSGAVAALVDDRDGVDPALRRLEERELVATRPVSSLVGQAELLFSHILTRDVGATAPGRATALEALGHGFRHAAMGDDSWRCFTQATDTLVESGSTDDERIAVVSGHALEAVTRWAGTNRTLPPEHQALRYL